MEDELRVFLGVCFVVCVSITAVALWLLLT
jgi:hypothetical protein